MTIKSKEEMVSLVVKCFPYANQICDWDFSTETNSIRFTWRGNRFRVSVNGCVEEVGNGVLMGSDLSILAEELLKRQYVSSI